MKNRLKAINDQIKTSNSPYCFHTNAIDMRIVGYCSSDCRIRLYSMYNLRSMLLSFWIFVNGFVTKHDLFSSKFNFNFQSSRKHNLNALQKFRIEIWFSIDFHFDIFYYRSTVVDFRIASDWKCSETFLYLPFVERLPYIAIMHRCACVEYVCVCMRVHCAVCLALGPEANIPFLAHDLYKTNNSRLFVFVSFTPSLFSSLLQNTYFTSWQWCYVV